jgi:urease accessory protein UreE
VSALQVFRSLPLAREIHRAESLPDASREYARDTVTLGWEDRLRARARRRSDRGVEFATALPRGTVLRAGDCFVLDPADLVVMVVEREEPVFVVEPRTPAEWGLYAYYIGNSHQPMMITEQAIVCVEAPGVAQIFAQHGIAYSRATRRFTPVSLLADHRH